jgi:hypothetical protein
MLGHEARFFPPPPDVGYPKRGLVKAGEAQSGAQYLSSSFAIVSIYLKHGNLVKMPDAAYPLHRAL